MRTPLRQKRKQKTCLGGNMQSHSSLPIAPRALNMAINIISAHAGRRDPPESKTGAIRRRVPAKWYVNNRLCSGVQETQNNTPTMACSNSY